jgi:hypothetical protein
LFGTEGKKSVLPGLLYVKSIGEEAYLLSETELSRPMNFCNEFRISFSTSSGLSLPDANSFAWANK